MRAIIKFKWAIAAVILALTVVLSLFSPNLTELANQKGRPSFPLMPFQKEQTPF